MKFKSKCKCGAPFTEHSRHVIPNELRVEDCKPSDNLEYLEFMLEKKERTDGRL